MSSISVQEYLAALKQNRLMGCRCKECGFITTPPRLACRKCSAMNFEVVELSGKGRIATLYRRLYSHSPPPGQKTPYLVVLVEMEEGPWVMGNLLGTDPAKATLDLIGQKVRMDNRLYGDIEPPDGIAPLFVLEN